jgi:predicted secreted hydrolase
MRRRLPVIVALLFLLLFLIWLLHRQRKPEQARRMAVNRVLGGVPAKGFLRAEAPRRFRFPQDHGAHPGFRNEWWYFTGNLKSGSGRSFGYQLTFFRVALTPHPVSRQSHWGTNEVFMAHFAVTDVEGGRFRYAERFSRAALGLAGAGGAPLQVRLEDWSALQSSARPWGMRLSAADPAMAIDLDLKSLVPEVLNGEGGLSRKGATPGNASYYYSIPRMATAGVIRVGGESFKVSGLSWLDREWSTSALERGEVGWDWFALQLSDGRDVMFYRLRRRDGGSDPFSSGTLILADGRSSHLTQKQVRLEISRRWTSPKTGARYPSAWRMTIPEQGIDLLITPKLPDQELAATFRYWEGAVAVTSLSGTAAGSGYLEMTGY